MNMENFYLPDIPYYDQESLAQLAENKEYGKVSFETLRSSATAAWKTIFVTEETEEFKSNQLSLRYRISIGHISKMFNLSTAILNLGSDDKYGDSVEIISNKVYKIGIQCLWIMRANNDCVDLYVNKSLVDEKNKFDTIKENAKPKIQNFTRGHFEKIFNSAGIEMDKFTPRENNLPSFSEMLKIVDNNCDLALLNELLHRHIETSYSNLFENYLSENKQRLLNPARKDIPSRPCHYFIACLIIFRVLENYCSTFFTVESNKALFCKYFSDGFKKIKFMMGFSLNSALPSFIEGVKKQTRKTKKETNASRKSDLRSYKQVKKVLISPLMQMKNIQTQSWSNDRFPNILWAIALRVGLGRERSFCTFYKLIKYLKEKDGAKGDITFTGISQMDLSLQMDIIDIILSDKDAKIFIAHIFHIRSIPARDLWLSKLKETTPSEDSWSFLIRCLSVNGNESLESLDCRWLKLACKVAAGEFRFAPGAVKGLGVINEYPRNPNPLSVAASIKSGEGIFYQLEDSSSETWIRNFWDELHQSTYCMPSMQDVPRDRVDYSPLNRKISLKAMG